METLPKMSPELNDATSQISKVCLGTPVILRQVLQQFSNGELLQLSLVNKHWNFEARSVLKNRGTLTAVTPYDCPPCQSLSALASDLRQMRVIPFSGVQLRLSHSGNNVPCQSATNHSLNLSSIREILELLPWKILLVDFHDSWANCKDCPAIVLVTKVLENFHAVLEQVSLTLQWEEVEVFQHVLIVTKQCAFPRLKSLKLDMQDAYGRLMELAKAFVDRAPKLQELHFMQSMSFHDNILEGRSSAVLVPSCRFNPLYDRICQSLISSLRPTEMEIYRHLRFEDFDEELLNSFIPTVLQASRSTLKTLRMDLLFALPLMCYGVRLKNVTSLVIRVDGRVRLVDFTKPWIMRFLKGFNFSRMFPKLRQVDIQDDLAPSISASQIMNFIEQGNVMLRKTLPDRAIRIQQLTLRGPMIYKSTPPLLAQMFPHVKMLSMFASEFSRAIPFTLVWSHFSFARELKVTITTSPELIDNLDSVFCGIFPEEVAELRVKDDEYLKTVNIVPVMPSITYMKDLRAFTLRYAPDLNFLTGTDDSFMFSKVTGLIAFARCPALAVTLKTVSYEYAEVLRHMKPYVSFVIAD